MSNHNEAIAAILAANSTEPVYSKDNPFYGARGKPGTLRRAINDAIDTYLAYECDTDTEQASELAVEYMFGGYGLVEGSADEATMIEALRLELATAHEVVGQAIAAMQAALTLVDAKDEIEPALEAARRFLRS